MTNISHQIRVFMYHAEEIFSCFLDLKHQNTNCLTEKRFPTP